MLSESLTALSRLLIRQKKTQEKPREDLSIIYQMVKAEVNMVLGKALEKTTEPVNNFELEAMQKVLQRAVLEHNLHGKNSPHLAEIANLVVLEHNTFIPHNHLSLQRRWSKEWQYYAEIEAVVNRYVYEQVKKKPLR